MCRLLHVQWRCKHEQTIWEYCRDSPHRTALGKRPCAAFLHKYGPSPINATADEYRNHCCEFACCHEDQKELYHGILALEAKLKLKYKESLPMFFRRKREKELTKMRKEFRLMEKRHKERCEALYYGLGWDGSHVYKRPASADTLVEEDEEGEKRGVVSRGHSHTRSEGGVVEGMGRARSANLRGNRMSAMSAPGP